MLSPAFIAARRTAAITHGKRNSPTYESWAHMIQRCTNAKNKDFGRYGGRGKTVCERWLKFENFLADMGERQKGMTLDRKDNAKGYQPDNCRWATRKDQSDNSTRLRMLTHGGKTQSISAWARELGLRPDTLHQRLHRGWPLTKALQKGTE